MPVSSDPDEDLPDYSMVKGKKKQKVTYSLSAMHTVE